MDLRIVQQIGHLDFRRRPNFTRIADPALTGGRAALAVQEPGKNLLETISIVRMNEKQHGLPRDIRIGVAERGMDQSQDHHFGRHQQYPFLALSQKNLEEMCVPLNALIKPAEIQNFDFLRRNAVEKMANYRVFRRLGKEAALAVVSDMWFKHNLSKIGLR